MYLSGSSIHQFVYVILNKLCDRWKFAQNIFTFMKLKSKHDKCNVKQRKNPPKISILHPSTHCVCIQFGWFFHSICSAMHISYYHLYQCMCLNVSVLNVCLSFGMWVDVRFFTHQIHSLLLIVFLKHFFRFHSLFLSHFYFNGYHCHDWKKMLLDTQIFYFEFCCKFGKLMM